VNSLGQSALILALTSFSLSFSVLARNARNTVFIAFAVMSGILSLWAFSFVLETILGSGTFYRIHLFFHVWLPPAALTFMRIMLRVEGRFSRRLLDLSVIVALCLTVALLFGLENWGWVRLLVYFSPASIFLQTLQLMWFDRRLKLGLRKGKRNPWVGLGRRTWIYLGAIAVLSLSSMDHLHWTGSIPPTIGNLLLAIYLYFISQAISQQRLLNFGALLSRFLVMGALAITLAAFYSLLVAWVENSPGLFFLNSFIASFLILMLLEPLRTVAGYFTKRLLTQKHRRLEQILRDSQRRLTGIVDQGALYQEVLLTIEQAIQPIGASLYVLRRDATRFRRVRAIGTELELAPTDPPAPKEVIVRHPLLEYCQTLRRKGEIPILLDQILENEMDRSATRAQSEVLKSLVQGLRALRCNMLIPIFAESEALGFITLHAPVPPDPWGSNWGLLPIVYPYFELAGRTLQNMEVFVRAREKERLAALGEMAAGLAHEIRNPLGAIRGAAQVLEDEKGGDPRLLGAIVEEVDRLNRVVSQFLEYSKPSNGAEPQVIELGTWVERTVQKAKPGLPDDILIAVDLPAETDLRVRGLAEQLQQVLLNLIQNSARALETVAHEKRIRVTVEALGQGDAREVHLGVEDNGPGIPRENLEKLFIPFFTTSPSGTGLGLSICQKIIEAHHGRIEVFSEPGRITRFTVVLPHAETET
jgi:signal transduction histidine kinase